MKMRRSLVDVSRSMIKAAPYQKGIFTYADLSNVISGGSPVANSRIISRLLRECVITKVQRGVYVTEGFDPWLLSATLEPDSYISMDSVLSRNGLVGVTPLDTVSVVALGGRKRRIKTKTQEIIVHAVTEELYFGFERRDGVNVADSEKAWLDTLYFYTKGRRYPFDPLREVNIRKLDKKKIEKYLKRYNNPKFVRFVKGLLYE